MSTLFDKDGNEVEAFLPDEHNAAIATAVTAKETEFNGVKTALEGTIVEKDKIISQRATEFQQFRKLNDEDKAKLTAAELTIYQNQEFMAKQSEEKAAAEKTAHDKSVEAAIRAKAGTDENLFTNIKNMYALIGLDDSVAGGIDQRLTAALGALGSTQPDLVAKVQGFSGGSYKPPVVEKEGEPSYADTPAGQAAAKEFGLLTEAPKQK